MSPIWLQLHPRPQNRLDPRHRAHRLTPVRLGIEPQVSQQLRERRLVAVVVPPIAEVRYDLLNDVGLARMLPIENRIVEPNRE